MLLLSIPCGNNSEKKESKVIVDLAQIVLRCVEFPVMISIVGAGGKTTVMMALAQLLAGQGKRVLVTTTTHIYVPDARVVSKCILLESTNINTVNGEPGQVTGLGDSIAGEKLKGITITQLDDVYLSGQFDVILVEADGAKEKPIKAPASHEPVVSKRSHYVIGVLGLDGLGKLVCDRVVHRLEYFMHVTGLNEGATVTKEAYVDLVINPEGLFKNTPRNAFKILVLNKAQKSGRVQDAQDILKAIKQRYKAGYDWGFYQ